MPSVQCPLSCALCPVSVAVAGPSSGPVSRSPCCLEISALSAIKVNVRAVSVTFAQTRRRPFPSLRVCAPDFYYIWVCTYFFFSFFARQCLARKKKRAKKWDSNRCAKCWKVFPPSPWPAVCACVLILEEHLICHNRILVVCPALCIYFMCLWTTCVPGSRFSPESVCLLRQLPRFPGLEEENRKLKAGLSHKSVIRSTVWQFLFQGGLYYI